MLKFSKYHGSGNDFILIEDRDRNLNELAQKMCHRTTGIGADGLLAVQRKPLSMRIFNRDGSEASMCGNGLRCFLCYCIDQGMPIDELCEVNTKAGIMKVHAVSTHPFSCTVDLGRPVLEASMMKIDIEASDFLHQKVWIGDCLLELSSVYIGTIHTVLYTEWLASSEADRLGSQICSHPLFKEKTNVDFVKVIDEHTLELITYERGVGVTEACGTGACAAAFMAVYDGQCQSPVNVRLPYGSLLIHVKNTILMQGPAVKIAEGFWQEY